jgi:hypothetical protein
MPFGQFVTATATAADGSTSEFSQAVAVHPTYAVWAYLNGIEGEPKFDDFGFVGVFNLWEYALGLNPTRSSAFPALERIGGGFQLVIPKGPDARLDPGITFRFQISTDLINWSNPPLLPTSEDSSQALFFLPGGSERSFVRLLIECQ